ncbi:MAG: delta-60 repeat domain-containing protein [Gammaproteobacteria bacterium]|nr:delta-60 repeat domain-containing protein [Gammaproteobacteria bacterium]
MNTSRKYLFRSMMGIITGTTLFMANPVFAAPGDLDTSFGTNGVVTSTIVSGAAEVIRAMAIQTDGKIVVAGYTFNTTNHIKRYALSRYNNDGSLDTSFGTSGTVVGQLSSLSDEPKDMIIQPDGKIVVLCSSWNVASGSSSEDVSLLRFNTDGTLDTSFDMDGSVVTDINMASTQSNNISADTPTRMALQPDGKILVSAQTRRIQDDIAVLRYNSDGSLDTTFDGTGALILDIGTTNSIPDLATAIAIQPDGKIIIGGELVLVSGSGNKDPFVARLDSDGTLDPTFGTDGVSESLDIKAGDDVKDILIQPDGKILVAGFSRDSMSTTNGADFLLIRYNSDGSLDTSFDTDGYVVTDGNAYSRDQGYSVVLQADGKILLGGLSGTSDMLLRYNTDGSLDSSFGTGGKATSPSMTWSWATAIQTDGNIVNAGYSSGTQTQFTLTRYEGSTLDTLADAFSFTDEIGASASTLVTSDMITVAGLGPNITVPLNVVDGEYALNGSTMYQRHIGYVQNGDQINVRHTSAANDGDSAHTIVNIGGRHTPDNTSVILGSVTRDIFTSTTGSSTTPPPTPTPDPDPDPTGNSSGGTMSGLLLIISGLILFFVRRSRLD